MMHVCTQIWLTAILAVIIGRVGSLTEEEFLRNIQSRQHIKQVPLTSSAYTPRTQQHNHQSSGRFGAGGSNAYHDGHSSGSAPHRRTRKRISRPTIITAQSVANNHGTVDGLVSSSRGGLAAFINNDIPDEDQQRHQVMSGSSSSRSSVSNLVQRSRQTRNQRVSIINDNSLTNHGAAAGSGPHPISAPRLTSPNPDGYKLVCYYTNWSQYRPKIGKFVPKDIDPHLCTHVVFAFGWIKNGRMASFESNDLASNDGKEGMYKQVTDLKLQNPNLKVLLAIGGWSFGTAKFKEVAETRFSRQRFIFSAIDFLRKHTFDGLDIDWEYPKSADKKKYTSLLKELRESFEAEAEENGNERLLLTAAMPVGPDNVRAGYEVDKVSKYLDFINLMAYDFHGKWEKQVGHNAPLHAPSSDSEWRKQLSVSFASQMWTRLGTPKHKLVIGMPTYGRSFTLSNRNKALVNSAARDGGKAGEFTREAGFLAYYEICQMLLDGASYVWDEEMQVPYLIKGDQWVGFDDERSIRGKMKWLKANGYAGAMVWSIDMDDFNGTVCGSGVKYPLIGAMRQELSGLPRQTVASGIEDADIDWEIVARSASPAIQSTAGSQQTANGSSDKTSIQRLLKSAKRVDVDRNTAGQANGLPDNIRPARVFCYFTNWSSKRPGMGKFLPSDIDPSLCTHIVLAFATIKDNELSPSDPADLGNAFNEGTYDRIAKLKNDNPEVKILLAVGGWAFGSEPFQQLTKNLFRMNGFVYNSLDFLRKHKFDGIDIDWEYPRGAEDKQAFVSLLREMRLAIEGEYKSNKRKGKLLLTAAVPASYEAIESGYDVPELSKYLDYINVMTYDFHGQWEKEIGHNSPLFPLNTANGVERKLTVDYAAKEWIRRGAPQEKLIVGMPVYGRTFELVDKNNFDIGAPVVGGGEPGRYTNERGFLSYYEICEFLHRSNTTLVWDNEQHVPFAYRDNQWIGFDDERSLTTKVEWLKSEGLGGIMVWSVDLDDFVGYCGTGKFPLLRAMVKELDNYYVELKYEGPYKTPGDKRSGSGADDEPESLCVGEQGEVVFKRHPDACNMYIVCQGTVVHEKTCPSGLVFNENENVCDWPSAVECQDSTSSE